MKSTPNHRLGVKAIIVRDAQILLVEYTDEDGGLHYNLPGGGVDAGETVQQAMVREVWEETGARVTVGDVVLVSEYLPAEHNFRFGETKKLTLIFRCDLIAGKEPLAPTQPDSTQTGLGWFPVGELPATLYPLFHDLLAQAIADDYPRPLFTHAL